MVIYISSYSARPRRISVNYPNYGSEIGFETEVSSKRLAYAPTSITLQPLTGNHAARCYFGNIQNRLRTSTAMEDDFDPINAFNTPNKGLKIIQLNTRSIVVDCSILLK